MDDAHVQAVARRATGLAARHDGRNSSHLLEMFTYLHAVAYHDFSRDEIDVTDAPTQEAMRRAVHGFGTAPRTFDATRSNAETLREALYTGSAPGLRHSQLDLIRKVLARLDRYHTDTHADPSWGGAALAALSVNYLGLYEGNDDTAFRTVAARNDAYRDAFRRFAGHTHLKGTPNEWTVRDALSEYARFGVVPSLRARIVADLGALLAPVTDTWGRGSAPWAKIASWLGHYDACTPYAVCKDDIERQLFPYTYRYDNGAMKVRTGLDRATVDQLYYASKQVKAQFHRVLGTQAPLAGDTNTVLTTVLYASRADYENYHPLLTGMGTDNGGVYIERGATFYTYQRRVPQDSRLTLEELFRHEYGHYRICGPTTRPPSTPGATAPAATRRSSGATTPSSTGRSHASPTCTCPAPPTRPTAGCASARPKRSAPPSPPPPSPTRPAPPTGTPACPASSARDGSPPASRTRAAPTGSSRTCPRPSTASCSTGPLPPHPTSPT
ncbi:hypothetical protein SGLAM104S_09459 [Streptomyces glaucescens]